MEEGARYLPQVSLRLALERAIGDLRFPIISKIRIGSFARLFLTMAYIVIIIAILIPSFDSRKNLFDIFKQINYAEHNISLLSVQIPWFIYEGYKGGNVDYSRLIEELGDQSSSIESVVNLSAPIKAGIIKLAQDALLSMNNLGSLIYHVNFEEMISLQDFSVSYLREKTPIYSCANYNHETTPFKLQDTINLDYMIRTFVTQSRILSRDSYEARAEYGISSLDFCEFYNNQVLVSDAFTSISGTVSVSVHMLFQHGDEEDDGEEYAKLLDSKLLNLSQSNNTFTNYSLSQSSKYNSKSQKILSKMSKLLDSDEENSDPEEGEEEEEEETESLDSLCDFFIAFSPFVLFAFILPSITFLSAGLTDEMNNFSKVLRTVPRNDCLKASERILKVQNSIAGKEKAKNYVTADKTNMANIPVWFFNLISAVVIIILVIVLAIYTKSVKVTLDEFCELFVLFTLKRNFIYDIGRELLYIHLINELGNQSFNSYFNISDNEARFNKYMKEYVMVSKVINLETDEFPSAIAIDSELSAIRFNSICDTPISSDRPANFYECISLDRAISYYIQLVNSVHATADKTSLLDSYCPYITHLLDTRMSTGYLRIFNRIESVYASTLYSFNVLIIVVTIVSIIFVLFEFFIEFIMLKTIQTQINTFKSLLLRVNPIAFVSNQNLLSLVYGKSKANDSHIISASHAVFMTSHDAMISLNDECIIESINPAATTIFGYTPEQMLGQNLKMLISPEYESNSQIYYNMQLMQSGQASLIFESDIIGKKDDENFVPLKVTLLGFSSNDKMAESFGLMCKDQTLETKQKNLVEEAKKQSENLLLQILPKDIIMRLNRGDTDISFTVPSATIVFIDIEKFSSYSASLSASEIMQNLGMVFTSYDKILHKFPLLIKIKLIGDDYMGAAGLFNPDSDPKEHAQQVVQFSLECLDAIEDLNEHLNASLQVRIGVNTNGPLIAGVLGTDKPLFDIIGDPINVAARLQSTDIPGCVQISQGTYDCVADSQFKIESRGEIELKGKGKQMTYLVYPSMRVNQSNASFSIGSTSSLPSEL
ncbi:adenylate cyclase type [Tritrichomonas foetus]|uniref:Adenylate cyclase type n=1 Tax=Tritrichomonas foetus TaxID=1144522 RepID=A0A1J4JKX1_9EUKA|nr:adenylate cyclase type [Tritrichomonas foetus]|eukprot:OHS98219.1 adenylate cyclase type [Tritrichomonas foetus]